MHHSTTYRPDIDGLRALAIIPVLLFHMDIAGFPGGFVGVDVFFVISGFLITSIIARELAAGSFSLIRFWERRMRRILPALFAVLLATAIAAYFVILFPSDFSDFGETLVAQALFLANIFFMRRSGYFAAPSESVPLLHTWSLSVEEQFYIGFPLLLFILSFFFSKTRAYMIRVVLIALCALSFGYNLYLTNLHPSLEFMLPPFSFIWGEAQNMHAGFYFLFARAWELLVGALLALGIVSVKRQWVATLMASIGLLCIVGAILFIDATSPFPGLYGLFPVIGCALLISAHTHHKTFISHLLSFPLFVGIGLISYSLYLWHWPVIVLFKTLWPLAPLPLFLLLPLIFVLAYLSYRFVETPFREKRICATTGKMYAAGIGSLLILIALGATIVHFKGFPDRAGEAANQIAEASVDMNPRNRECFRKNLDELFSDEKLCLLGDQDPAKPVDFILWGDSHADAVMPIVDTLAREHGIKGRFFGAGGCKPIMWSDNPSNDERCAKVNAAALSFIQTERVPKVLLVSSWTESPYSASSTKDTEPTLRSELLAITKHASREDTTFFVMERVPIFYEYEHRAAFMQAARSDAPMTPSTKTLAEHRDADHKEQTAIESLAREGVLVALDPAPLLCPNGVCSNVIDGRMVYRDNNHLTATGSFLLRPLFETFFTR